MTGPRASLPGTRRDVCGRFPVGTISRNGFGG